jgi:hypothetical protein
MKNWKYYLYWVIAILGFCSFLFFFNELQASATIGKWDSFWDGYCRDNYAMQTEVCCTNFNIIFIFLSSVVFWIMSLLLFVRYKWWVLSIPFISVITWVLVIMLLVI